MPTKIATFFKNTEKYQEKRKKNYVGIRLA